MKQYLLVYAILSLCIYDLSMSAEEGRPFSGKDDGSLLISTPIPVQAIGRPWGAKPLPGKEIPSSFPETVRPPARQTTPCFAGENLSAVNIYLSNDFSAEAAVFIVGGIRNTGISVQNNITVQFFLGDPENGGMQIGPDRIVSSLTPGSTAYDSVSWSGFTGQSQIYCVVDPHQAVAEEDESDNTDSLMVGMVDDVPWVWQEVNGYCHYASQTMLFNFLGAGHSVYQTLELACCPHSIAYQASWLALYSGWILSQGGVDIEFAGQIRNLSTDLVVKTSWSSYLAELRQRINAGQPCETSVDPYWLPQPDYDLLRSYGLHSGHGVVIIGYTDDAIIVNDPGVGLNLLEEPPIPDPQNRGASVVIGESTFRNAVEWTYGTRYLLLSYTPTGPMPSSDDMLTQALDRSIWRLGGDAGTFEPVFWEMFNVFGRDCFLSFCADATLETFQKVFNNALCQTGGNLAEAVNMLAAGCDLWGCGICWNAAAVFYGTQSYPQASKLSGFSAQLSIKGDEAWDEYIDLLEAVYTNGGNTSIAGPYLSQIQSTLDPVVALEDSMLVQLNSLYGWLTQVEAESVSNQLPAEPGLSCYPNPFNDRAVLRYALAEEGPIRLAVYNIIGQRVRSLADGHHPAGYYQIVWDSKDDHGEQVSSGLYFCRLDQKTTAQTVKLVFLK